MQAIALASQKGGSGKTSAAVNLGAALAERGRRVLVLDLDPQRSASAWLGVPDDGAALLEVLTGKGTLAELVRPTAWEGLEVIPSGPALAGAERVLAARVGAELSLRRALARMPASHDVLLVDCPPSLGLLTVAALAACPRLVVPVEASSMALAAVEVLEGLAGEVREAYHAELELWALLACRVAEHTRIGREVVRALRARYGAKVLRAVIHESTRMREAWGFAQPVTVYAPRSSAADDYRAAAGELIRKGGKT